MRSDSSWRVRLARLSAPQLLLAAFLVYSVIHLAREMLLGRHDHDMLAVVDMVDESAEVLTIPDKENAAQHLQRFLRMHVSNAALRDISYAAYVSHAHDDGVHPVSVTMFVDEVFEFRKQQQLAATPVARVSDLLQSAVESMDVEKLDDAILEANKYPKADFPLLASAKYLQAKLLVDGNTVFGQRAKQRHAASPAANQEQQQQQPQQQRQHHQRVMDPRLFPIGVVASTRPELLKKCLQSLLSLDGLGENQITVYQDGTHEGVAEVARTAGKGVRLVQRTDRSMRGPIVEGAQLIASMYKFVLSHLFDSNPKSPYVIVVEDDMVFSPDFLHFFAQLAWLYEADPTVYCITSWNDNGRVGLAKDKRALYRTDFFVGLGWLVSRKIYKGEWEAKWPPNHWDHWARHPAQRQGRECIYPEVSRNFNIGVRGVHSDSDLYDKYFRHHMVNKDGPRVDLGNVSYLISEKYEAHVKSFISEDSEQLSSLAGLDKKRPRKANKLTIFFQATGPEDPIWEQDIAPYFNLWHSIPNIRGMHKGVQRFRWKGNQIALVASYSPYAYLRKSGVEMLTRQSFARSFADLDSNVHVIVAARGESCDQACRSQSRSCDVNALPFLNNCEALRKYMDGNCPKGCDQNMGTDQPAMVVDAEHANYGKCLVNGGAFSCAGRHPVTIRLCGCR